MVDACPKLINILQKQTYLCNKEFEKDESAGISDVECTGLQVLASIKGPEGTAYYGGKFRVKLMIVGNDFPRSPPKAFFQTKIFHPNINNSTGDVCVNALQKDWDPANWSLAHIFRIIRCLLIIPFPESALNQDAAKLFMESYTEFLEHAKMMTELYAMEKPPVLSERNQNVGSTIGTTNKTAKKKSALRRL